MAGTATVTRRSATLLGREIEIIRVAWTGDASDGTVPDTSLGVVAGQLERITTNPGSTAPTANYDITVEDEDGLDMLGGAGANRHTSNSEEAALPLGTYFLRTVADTLTFKLAGQSVASATGVFKLYIRK